MVSSDYEDRPNKAKYRIEILKNMNIEAQSINEYFLADGVKTQIKIAEESLEEILKEQ